MKLTAPQRRGLEILAAQTGAIAPRDFARQMWPDSPAWDKRTRGQRGGNRSGAMGGTMPMIGARLLWRLQDLQCAGMIDYRWVITQRGRQRLTEPS